MSKKPPIPPVPVAGNPREKFDSSIAQTLEIITGRRGDRVQQLSSDATNADVINKINELIILLQQ